VDFGAVADLARHFREEVEGNRGAVELAAAVVGEQDGVDAQVGGAHRVGDRLDPLHDEFPGPLVLDPREVVVGHRRVEHRVEQLGDRARPAVERGEGERLGREEVRVLTGPLTTIPQPVASNATLDVCAAVPSHADATTRAIAAATRRTHRACAVRSSLVPIS
jgi:hypothetical protein